ncbi:MAG: hypothetical protein LBU77_02920, partial [Clostridiales bacterium]|nr:hypothetical protein [Clostridiales bacterium]
MSCHFHRDREATTTCSSCGKFICEECTIEVDDRILCKNCVISLVKGESQSKSFTGYDSVPRKPLPTSSYRGDDRYYKSGPRHFSGFLTFCCSAMPGGGQMYLGLIKRGISFLASFFLSIYLCTVTNGSVIAAFLLIASMLASFFDAFRIRRLLNAGVAVDDNFDDLLLYVKKYWLIVLILFAFDFARYALSRIWSGFYGFHSLFG